LNQIFPEITEKELERKKCILVKFEGLNRPYYAYGRAYMRVGDENRQLSSKELEKLILEKNKTFWEKGFSDKKLKDINEETVKGFMEKANKAKRINFKFQGVKPTLNRLGLLKENRLLNAGEILFCDENSFEVQAAVFAGTDKLTFLDIRQFKGNLFNLQEQSETYIKEHIDWRAELGAGGREEIPEIPVRAITEAVVNSLCHRDYTNPNANKIAVFKNRIEIYNPGQFPEGYEPEDFIKGKTESILRNPLIANTLYLSADIERWASGLKRICDACKGEGVRVEFEKRKNSFVVVFYRRKFKTVEETVEETVEKILRLIKENPRITQEKLAKKTELTRRGIECNIEKL